MKINEAIRKLKDLTRYAYEPESKEALDALILGIRALERHQSRCQTTFAEMMELLHGEEKE